MKQISAVLLLAMTTASVSAADATVTLGAARVRYDDARWRPLPSEGSVRFEPIGDAARKLDPVELHIADASASCKELASRAFTFGHYDVSEITGTPVFVGGVAAERFAAHTRCRNATPQGVVICVKSGGSAYLLQSLNPGCLGRNPFSGINPLAEIANGLSFAVR